MWNSGSLSVDPFLAETICEKSANFNSARYMPSLVDRACRELSKTPLLVFIGPLRYELGDKISKDTAPSISPWWMVNLDLHLLHALDLMAFWCDNAMRHSCRCPSLIYATHALHLLCFVLPTQHTSYNHDEVHEVPRICSAPAVQSSRLQSVRTTAAKFVVDWYNITSM